MAVFFVALQAGYGALRALQMCDDFA